MLARGSVVVAFCFVGANALAGCLSRTIPGLRDPAADGSVLLDSGIPDGGSVGDAGDGGETDAGGDASIGPPVGPALTADPPVLLFSTYPSHNPAVVTDREGNALAAWSSAEVSVGTHRWAARRAVATGTWEPVVLIDFGNDAGPDNLSLGGDEYGRAVLLGGNTVGGISKVRVAPYVLDGGGWAGASTLADDWDGWDVRVAMEASGFSGAAWISGTNLIVKDARFGANADAGVLYSSSSNIRALDVAVNASEETFVVWQNADAVVRAALWKDAGIAGPWLLDTVNTDSTNATPRIALGDYQSSPVAVWRSVRPGEEGRGSIWTSEWELGPGFRAAVRLSDSATQSEPASEPRISQGRGGSTLVVWTTDDGPSGLVGSFHPFNASWGPALPISTAGLGFARQPAVAATTDFVPTFIIVWSQSNGSRWRIYAAKHVNGAMGPPLLLEDAGSENGESSDPAVAQLPDGGGIVVWLREQSGVNAVFATAVH